MNTTDTITIPVYKKTSQRTSCDCPARYYHIKCLCFPFYKTLKDNFELLNPDDINLQPFQYYEIDFNMFVKTSLPGYCIIYGTDWLYLKGLIFYIRPVRTNDEPLKVCVYNPKNEHLVFKKKSMIFYCKIVIARF
jgi:hypothetical protein